MVCYGLLWIMMQCTVALLIQSHFCHILAHTGVYQYLLLARFVIFFIIHIWHDTGMFIFLIKFWE
jgi:hypothetical protein